MSWLAHLRARRIADEIAERSAAYEQPYSTSQRHAWQLRAWNQEWCRILREVPYYAELATHTHLPREFRSWQRFLDLMPTTSRATLQRFTKEMACQSRPHDFLRTTGGSTAEPIQLPAWNTENAYARPDAWLARSWYGIRPSAPLFLLWGHSHLLGEGIQGWLRGRRRKMADRLLGYYRYSAYDLSADSLRQAAQRMIEFKPEWVVGYSVALDQFARANQDCRPELRSLGLKVVVGAAEGFPWPDSVPLISDLFGCPVAMEYGSVETNLVAHTHPAGGFRVFWRNYFVEVVGPAPLLGSGRIRVTSLFPRCFPLVRYELGDEIESREAVDLNGVFGIDHFQKVIGRCNDYVQLSDGTRVHSEAFTHAIRSCAEVSAYQVVQEGSALHLCLVARKPLSPQVRRMIQAKLMRIHPDLAQAQIKPVSRLEQTIAGKVPMILRKPAAEQSEARVS